MCRLGGERVGGTEGYGYGPEPGEEHWDGEEDEEEYWEENRVEEEEEEFDNEMDLRLLNVCSPSFNPFPLEPLSFCTHPLSDFLSFRAAPPFQTSSVLLQWVLVLIRNSSFCSTAERCACR